MIRIAFKGKSYDLEYSRRSVRQMEARGFALDEISTKPVTMIPLLVHGAFKKNHPLTSTGVIDEIYENIVNKTGTEKQQGFIMALVEEYSATVNSTFDEPNDEGNAAVWTVVK